MAIEDTTYDDISQEINNLYAEPFNAGKVNINVKSPGFELNSCAKDGLINSNVELTSPDVLLGLANGFKLPLVTNFDGTKFTGTLSKEVENFKFQAQGTYSPETGSIGDLLKVDFKGQACSAGISIDITKPTSAILHAVANYKDIKVGFKGNVDDKNSFKYTLAPTKQLIIETDLNKVDVKYLMPSEKHQVGVTFGWVKDTKVHSFGFAAKKFTDHADYHVNTDLTGALALSHVSKLDIGEFKNVNCTLGGKFNVLKWSAPVFGLGLDFSF